MSDVWTFRQLPTYARAVCCASMQLTINIPDVLLDDVKHELASQPTGVLETIALDAILGFLNRLRDRRSSNQRVE